MGYVPVFANTYQWRRAWNVRIERYFEDETEAPAQPAPLMMKDEATLTYGEPDGRSLEAALLPSRVELTLDDPGGAVMQLIRDVPEGDLHMCIESNDDAFAWRGRLRSSTLERPLVPGVERRQLVVYAYDGVKQLEESSAMLVPAFGDAPAPAPDRPMISVFREAFGRIGLTLPALYAMRWRPRELGATGSAFYHLKLLLEDYETPGEVDADMRSQIEEYLSYFRLRLWQAPSVPDGLAASAPVWMVVPAPAVGRGLTGVSSHLDDDGALAQADLPARESTLSKREAHRQARGIIDRGLSRLRILQNAWGDNEDDLQETADPNFTQGTKDSDNVFYWTFHRATYETDPDVPSGDPEIYTAHLKANTSGGDRAFIKQVPFYVEASSGLHVRFKLLARRESNENFTPDLFIWVDTGTAKHWLRGDASWVTSKTPINQTLAGPEEPYHELSFASREPPPESGTVHVKMMGPSETDDSLYVRYLDVGLVQENGDPATTLARTFDGPGLDEQERELRFNNLRAMYTAYAAEAHFNWKDALGTVHPSFGDLLGATLMDERGPARRMIAGRLRGLYPPGQLIAFDGRRFQVAGGVELDLVGETTRGTWIEQLPAGGGS